MGTAEDLEPASPSALLRSAARLVSIASVSGDEAAIADHVERVLRSAPWLLVERVGDNVVALTDLGRMHRLLVAGHLDTVPANGNEGARMEGGTLWGLGATDMKGGLAVMLDLATTVPAPAHDVTYVFYASEEVARVHNGLLAVDAVRPALLAADAAIVCEPTSCALEAGCQGVLKVELVLAGDRAHVARPWRGRNALHRLAPVLSAVALVQPREVEIDGCVFRESFQAVRCQAGVASNVLPDRAVLELNYRFAPDLDVVGAFAVIERLVSPWMAPGDALEVVDSAPAAPPALGGPILSHLAAASGRGVVAKLGWTDVAFFAERGVPAANFGPGDSELAHTASEYVTANDLEEARSVLGKLLASSDLAPSSHALRASPAGT